MSKKSPQNVCQCKINRPPLHKSLVWVGFYCNSPNNTLQYTLNSQIKRRSICTVMNVDSGARKCAAIGANANKPNFRYFIPIQLSRGKKSSALFAKTRSYLNIIYLALNCTELKRLSSGRLRSNLEMCAVRSTGPPSIEYFVVCGS